MTVLCCISFAEWCGEATEEIAVYEYDCAVVLALLSVVGRPWQIVYEYDCTVLLLSQSAIERPRQMAQCMNINILLY